AVRPVDRHHHPGSARGAPRHDQRRGRLPRHPSHARDVPPMTLPPSLVSVGYIAAGILFILSLGGLSTPERACRGNLFGVAGMILALAAATFSGHVTGYGPLVAAVVPAVLVGATLAARVGIAPIAPVVAILPLFVRA